MRNNNNKKKRKFICPDVSTYKLLLLLLLYEWKNNNKNKFSAVLIDYHLNKWIQCWYSSFYTTYIAVYTKPYNRNLAVMTKYRTKNEDSWKWSMSLITIIYFLFLLWMAWIKKKTKQGPRISSLSTSCIFIYPFVRFFSRKYSQVKKRTLYNVCVLSCLILDNQHFSATRTIIIFAFFTDFLLSIYYFFLLIQNLRETVSANYGKNIARSSNCHWSQWRYDDDC